MSFTGKFLGIATLSLGFSASAGAQAPQVEKNVARLPVAPCGVPFVAPLPSAAVGSKSPRPKVT